MATSIYCQSAKPKIETSKSGKKAFLFTRNSYQDVIEYVCKYRHWYYMVNPDFDHTKAFSGRISVDIPIDQFIKLLSLAGDLQGRLYTSGNVIHLK